MNKTRKPSFRFLSLLLALCLLLTVIPATAESPATPTDLGPIEEITEAQEIAEQQEDVRVPGEAEELSELENAEQPEESKTAEEPGEQPAEEQPETAEQPEAEEQSGAMEQSDAEEQLRKAEQPEAEVPEKEQEKADPFLAFLQAGARLYADRNCYRRQQLLAEEAVVLVVKTEEKASEILYAYADVSEETVPGKAYVHAADLRPLTEEETEAWQAAEHPDAVERMGFRLERVTFGTELVAEPEETEENPTEESGEELEEESGEEAGTEADAEVGTEPDGEPEEEQHKDLTTGHLAAEQISEQSELSEASSIGAEATPTDLSGAMNEGAGELNGSSVVSAEASLPAVRDQGQTGICWAFSAIGAMEIYLIKQGNADASSIDLSEEYLAYYTFHTYPNPKPGGEGDKIENTGSSETYWEIGGTNMLAFRVLANLIGTLTESQAPLGSTPPSEYTTAATQMTGAYLVNVSREKITTIKNLITDHGAVGASIYMPEKTKYNKITDVGTGGKIGYNSTTYALYGTTTKVNHDILLVGWDDNFPKDNFVEGLRPSSNGAWKARNSWGTGWGNGGYFWISYEDAALAGTEGTAYSAINNSTANDEIPDYCYSYDKIPDLSDYENTNWVLKKPSPVTMTQTFNLDGHEKILSIGVETGTANVTLKADVTVNDITYSGSVQADYKGFYRIKLNQAATVYGQTTVTVTITYTAKAGDGTQVIIPYEPGNTSYRPGSAQYRYTTHSGSGGFKLNNETVSNADSCIKVYTKKDNTPYVTDVKMKCSSPVLGPAQSISISDATVGKTYQLVAVLTHPEGADTNVRWISTNTAAATVSNKGLVTIKSTGSTDIYATAVSGVRAVCHITVPNPALIPVSSVTLSQSSAELTEGESVQLSATVYPTNATNKGVTWSSSNTGVATVSAGGFVQTVKAGSATITVKTRDGGKTATCSVKVNAAPQPAPQPSPQPQPVQDKVEAFVVRCYKLMLNRAPDAAGLADWTSQLKNHTKNASEIIYGFMYSIEYSSRGLSNDQTVEILYNTMLNRGSDAAGKADWLNRLANGQQIVDIINGFCGSAEFLALCNEYGIIAGSVGGGGGGGTTNAGVTAFVTRLYTKMLGRAADPAGLADWSSRIMAKPTKDTLLNVALDGFMHSPEFQSKGLSNTEFVKVLYRTFLDREYDNAGLQDWVSKLQSGATRDKVAAGFAYSPEFDGIMSSYGF